MSPYPFDVEGQVPLLSLGINERPDALISAVRSLNRVLLVGGGSLGSAFSTCLRRMNVRHDICDPDRWQKRNFANSLPLGNGGHNKGNIPMTCYDALHDEEEPLDRPYSFIVTATDSIESRKEVFAHTWSEAMNLGGNSLGPAFFIDVRTASNSITLVSSNSAAFMEESLPDEDNVEDPGCGERGTMFHTLMLGGWAAQRLTFLALEEKEWGVRVFNGENTEEEKDEHMASLSTYEQIQFGAPLRHIRVM